ncbi:hypothetical protein QYF61_020567 [Mycteria americana]|uniref:Uncharacterized protein n=1 Tax=Mycteria americana TaxID=33587 RepID=A0AAN7NCB1_MYCAM|nr:hypothetical protein QYF61_020567 [Mycteria americana]
MKPQYKAEAERAAMANLMDGEDGIIRLYDRVGYFGFSVHNVELTNLMPFTKSAESEGRKAMREELAVIY